MLFSFYRLFDGALIFYLLFIFPSNTVLPASLSGILGVALAVLIGIRLVMSLVPSIPAHDSYVFDLVDCTHHHSSSSEKEERIRRQH